MRVHTGEIWTAAQPSDNSSSAIRCGARQNQPLPDHVMLVRGIVFDRVLLFVNLSAHIVAVKYFIAAQSSLSGVDSRYPKPLLAPSCQMFTTRTNGGFYAPNNNALFGKRKYSERVCATLRAKLVESDQGFCAGHPTRPSTSGLHRERTPPTTGRYRMAGVRVSCAVRTAAPAQLRDNFFEQLFSRAGTRLEQQYGCWMGNVGWNYGFRETGGRSPPRPALCARWRFWWFSMIMLALCHQCVRNVPVRVGFWVLHHGRPGGICCMPVPPCWKDHSSRTRNDLILSDFAGRHRRVLMLFCIGNGPNQQEYIWCSD